MCNAVEGIAMEVNLNRVSALFSRRQWRPYVDIHLLVRECAASLHEVPRSFFKTVEGAIAHDVGICVAICNNSSALAVLREC